MSRKNAEIEAEKQRYLDIFARHNVERLATVKEVNRKQVQSRNHRCF